MQIDTASILAFVMLAALIIVAWRSGKSPETGRAMLKEHARLKSRLTSVEEALKGCATRSDVAALSGKIDALEEHAASAGDINALEGKINVCLTKIDAVEKAADRTESSVEWLKNYFIQRGIEK